MYKFGQPWAGSRAWEEYAGGRGQTLRQLREAERTRPMIGSMMAHRVAQDWPVLNWFMREGDVARLDPRASKHRKMLAQGYFRPGSPLGAYRSPRGWGWTNPFGIGHWATDISNWMEGRDPQQAERQQIVEKLRGSQTLTNLMDRFSRGTVSQSELQRLTPVDIGELVSPERMRAAKSWAEAYRMRAAAEKFGPELQKSFSQGFSQSGQNPYKGVPRHIIDPYSDIKRQAIGMKTGSLKLAAFDWLVNQGNQRFDVRLEQALENPATAGKFFTEVKSQMSGESPKWYQWLNPITWARQSYLSDPRAQAHIRSRMAQRLAAKDTMARLFPNRRGRAGSLFELMGPLGIGGTAGILTGLATRNPWIAGAGALALGGQGLRQYMRARDPQTWISAFTQPTSPAERLRAQRSRRFLSNIGGLLHGKSAADRELIESLKSEKTGSWFSADTPKFRPVTQDQHNENALRLLRTHFPVSEGKKSISRATNMQFGQKLRLMNAYDQATADDRSSTGRGSTTLGKVLPSLVGAGLGYMGGALAAPILGFDRKTKQRFGIGTAALGAILNNPHLTGTGDGS